MFTTVLLGKLYSLLPEGETLGDDIWEPVSFVAESTYFFGPSGVFFMHTGIGWLEGETYYLRAAFPFGLNDSGFIYSKSLSLKGMPDIYKNLPDLEDLEFFLDEPEYQKFLRRMT